MAITLYIFISFIVCFISWKKYSKQLYDDTKGPYDNWIESKYFWYILVITLFWYVVIPGIILWKVLDYIYNRLNIKL